MITSGWLVCFECEGSGWIGLMESLMLCPECDGTGEPRPGTYEVDSEDDLFDHPDLTDPEWAAELEAFDTRDR